MTTSLFGAVRVHLCAFLPDGKTRHRSTRGDRLPNPWPILFVPARTDHRSDRKRHRSEHSVVVQTIHRVQGNENKKTSDR